MLTRPEESYRVGVCVYVCVCVCVCVCARALVVCGLETSTMRLSRPTRAVEPWGKNYPYLLYSAEINHIGHYKRYQHMLYLWNLMIACKVNRPSLLIIFYSGIQFYIFFLLDSLTVIDIQRT